MTSQKIIERLQKSDWFIRCETEHEIALVLNSCLDAKIKWCTNEIATSSPPCLDKQLFIDHKCDEGLSWCDSDAFIMIEYTESEDLTEWFFEELRNN